MCFLVLRWLFFESNFTEILFHRGNFQIIILYKNGCILVQIPLKYAFKGSTDNELSLIHMMDQFSSAYLRHTASMSWYH